MNYGVKYINPNTGLYAALPVVPDPVAKLEQTGVEYSPDRGQEIFLEMAVDTTIAGRGGVRYLPITELFDDVLHQGECIPAFSANRQGTFLATDIAADAKALTSEAYLKTNGEPIFEAGAYYWIMDRRPDAGERFNLADYGAELIRIDDAYTAATDLGSNDGGTPTISGDGGTGGAAAAHTRGAYIERAFPSMGCTAVKAGEMYGLIYERERPAAVTGVAGDADNCTASTLAITFNASSYATVKAYAVYVLKKGQSLSPYGAPIALPDYVVPAQYDDGGQTQAIYPLDSAELTMASGVYSLSGLNRYYDAATRALTALSGSTDYYVAVRAWNQTTIDENLRMSVPTVAAVSTTA